MPHYSKVETIEVIQSPKPGDYFTEMMNWRCWVLAVNNSSVSYLEAIPPCTIPDDGRFRIESLNEFYNRFVNGQFCWIRLLDRNYPVEGWLEYHMKKQKLSCCDLGRDFIRWMTAADADSDEDGWYISLHSGYPDAVYELVSVCPFCGVSIPGVNHGHGKIESQGAATE